MSLQLDFDFLSLFELEWNALLMHLEEIVAGRVRRSYGLTDEGSAALRAEAQRMAEAARLVTGEETSPRASRLARRTRTA